MNLRNALQLIILSMVVSAIVGFIGCGGDDSATSLTNTLTGQDYTTTRTEVNGLVDSTMAVVSKGLSVVLTGTNDTQLDLLPGMFYDNLGGSSGASPEGDWYVLTAMSLAAGVNSLWIDSLQFLRQGLPLENFAQADGMKIRHRWESYKDDTTTSYSDYRLTGSYTVTNLDGDISLLNGTSSLLLTRKEVNPNVITWKEYTVSVSFGDVSINRDDWVNGCPSSGTADATVEVITTTDAGQVDTLDYDFSFAFSLGTMTGNVTSGSKSAEYTIEYCRPATSN